MNLRREATRREKYFEMTRIGEAVHLFLPINLTTA